MPLVFRCFLPAVFFFAVAAGALGHPTPDIPVRAFFEKGGSARIQVEVDPRLFADNPEEELYLQSWTLEETSREEREKLQAQAAAYIRKAVEFRFEPLGSINPEFSFTFTTLGGGPFTKPDDPLVLTGEWQTAVPSGIRGYQIKARPEGGYSVLFVNTLMGEKVERFQALFPGEESFVLDLSGMESDRVPGRMSDSVGAKAS